MTGRSRATMACLSAVLLAAACAAAQGQASRSVPATAAPEGKPVPERPGVSPFAIDKEAAGRIHSIELRGAAEMSEADRRLQADAAQALRERADLEGFDLERDAWTARQVVCPATPQHLLLRYTRDEGVGLTTEFTAAIPRGAGLVRVVPVTRRGRAAVSSQGENAYAVAAFNRIWTEEAYSTPPDWLTTALCYAALAGATPSVKTESGNGDASGELAAAATGIEVALGGGETVRFVDAAARPRPMSWTLSFDRSGKLLKATSLPEKGALRLVIVVPQETELKSKPIPETDLSKKTKIAPER